MKRLLLLSDYCLGSPVVFSAWHWPTTDTKPLRSLRIGDAVREPPSAIASNVIVYKQSYIKTEAIQKQKQ